MPISVTCACGATLRVRNEVAGKRVRCPKCSAIVRAPEPALVAAGSDDGFRIIEETPPPARRACPYCTAAYFPPASSCPTCLRSFVAAPPRAIARAATPTAWEVGVVLFLLGLGLLGNILMVVEGKGNPLGCLFGLLMFFGVLSRSNGGWWLTVVLSTLGGLGCLWLASEASSHPLLAAATPMFYLAAGLETIIVGLLVACRLRGAYLKD